MEQSLHLWSFIIICSAPSAITCGHPGNPANGRTNGSEFNLNDVVNFTCNRGYVLSGSARAQCRLNGQWSSTLPVCKGHQLSHTTSPETQIFLLMLMLWFTYGMQSAQYCFVHFDTQCSPRTVSDRWRKAVRKDTWHEIRNVMPPASEWGWTRSFRTKISAGISSDMKLNHWAVHYGGLDPKSGTCRRDQIRDEGFLQTLWGHFHIQTHTHLAQTQDPSNTVYS